MKYYVPFTWIQHGFHVVEADSAERAEEMAAELPLPDPQCEEDNEEYGLAGDAREATPEEIATYERMSDREALRVCAEALLRHASRLDKEDEMDAPGITDASRDALTHARAAGVLP